MRKRLYSFPIYLMCVIMMVSFSSCHGRMGHDADIDSTKVRQLIADGLSSTSDERAWNVAVHKYYADGGDLLWLSPVGKVRIRIFLTQLRNLNRHGVNPNRLGLQLILQAIDRNEHSGDASEFERTLCQAHLEYLLTRAYLHYICGLRYGFVNPSPIYNNLYEDLNAYSDSVPPPPDRKKKMFHLYNIPLQHATVDFAIQAIRRLKEEPITALKEAIPATLYYKKLQVELQLVRHEHAKANCVRANLERARWHYKQPLGRRYVFVNTAMCMLKAVDMDRDTLFEMKICCGSFKHKTPFIASELTYFELNPNWVVPPKIIKKEFIPAFARDSNFFARNHLRVYDKKGNQLNARRINWAKFAKSGIPFKVKQDSGEGSDLGRIIFRFPNRFSVYLHDTSSRGTFGHEDRGVSHGCVRLERPLDLAYFLMEYPKAERMDHVRLAVGQQPVSEKGKQLAESGAFKPRRFYGFKAVPLFIDYRTIYLAADGNLQYANDHYQYDAPLVKALRKMKY